MQVELWFPTAIWSDSLKIDNQELAKFSYRKKEIDPGIDISNYYGWQSNGIKNGENEFIDALVDEIDIRITDITEKTGLPKLVMSNLWININPPGAFNLLHDHPGCILSGCYYISANEDQGNIVFERNDNAQYFLPSLKNRNYFNSTSFAYKSTTSALYIFPSWLKHRVEPNNSTTDRISIAFNYIEKKHEN